MGVLSERIRERILRGFREMWEIFRRAYQRGGIWWVIFTLSMIAIALDFLILVFILLRFL